METELSGVPEELPRDRHKIDKPGSMGPRLRGDDIVGVGSLPSRHPEVRAAFAASLEGWTSSVAALILRGSQVLAPQNDDRAY